MDPKAALLSVQRGERAAECARAYNEWRAGQGFAARVRLPASQAYRVGAYWLGIAGVQRVYRGHRCWMVRVERLGGQGFRTYPLADVEVV